MGAAAAAGCVVGIAGCGSSSSSSSGTTGNGEESKSAEQIFADVISSFDAQQAIHSKQTVVDSTGTTKVESILTPSAGRSTITDSGGTVTVILVDNGSAWLNQGGTGFQQLSGSDVQLVAHLTVHGTATCARTERGGLTKGAISTVDGQRVIALADDGKAPGASVGTLYVALDGPPLPVRAVQTGPSTAGGSLTCGHSGPDTTSSVTIDFDYPASASVTPPPAGAGGSSTGTDTGSSTTT